MWGEPMVIPTLILCIWISTHSPRVGRTPLRAKNINTPLRFQLTRPVWGEPLAAQMSMQNAMISTHSPRVGRTHVIPRSRIVFADFNSLAPCGANPPAYIDNFTNIDFNSLAPCGANPRRRVRGSCTSPISTHSPRVGRTRPEQCLAC